MSDSEMIDGLLDEARERMAKSVEAMRHEFGGHVEVKVAAE